MFIAYSDILDSSGKKAAPDVSIKKAQEKNIDEKKKSKTVAETDRDKLDKKFSKKKIN